MTHILEVLRDTPAEVCSFLDGLYFSDWVSAIGYRKDDQGKVRAIAANWNEDETNELDQLISQMIEDALLAGEELDEGAAYCRVFPETVQYRPK